MHLNVLIDELTAAIGGKKLLIKFYKASSFRFDKLFACCRSGK
jgi:hypothetical protein